MIMGPRPPSLMDHFNNGGIGGDEVPARTKFHRAKGPATFVPDFNSVESISLSSQSGSVEHHQQQHPHQAKLQRDGSAGVGIIDEDAEYEEDEKEPGAPKMTRDAGFGVLDKADDNNEDHIPLTEATPTAPTTPQQQPETTATTTTTAGSPWLKRQFTGLFPGNEHTEAVVFKLHGRRPKKRPVWLNVDETDSDDEDGDGDEDKDSTDEDFYQKAHRRNELRRARRQAGLPQNTITESPNTDAIPSSSEAELQGEKTKFEAPSEIPIRNDAHNSFNNSFAMDNDDDDDDDNNEANEEPELLEEPAAPKQLEEKESLDVDNTVMAYETPAVPIAIKTLSPQPSAPRPSRNSVENNANALMANCDWLFASDEDFTAPSIAVVEETRQPKARPKLNEKPPDEEVVESSSRKSRSRSASRRSTTRSSGSGGEKTTTPRARSNSHSKRSFSASSDLYKESDDDDNDNNSRASSRMSISGDLYGYDKNEDSAEEKKSSSRRRRSSSAARRSIKDSKDSSNLSPKPDKERGGSKERSKHRRSVTKSLDDTEMSSSKQSKASQRSSTSTIGSDHEKERSKHRRSITKSLDDGEQSSSKHRRSIAKYMDDTELASSKDPTKASRYSTRSLLSYDSSKNGMVEKERSKHRRSIAKSLDDDAMASSSKHSQMSRRSSTSMVGGGDLDCSNHEKERSKHRRSITKLDDSNSQLSPKPDKARRRPSTSMVGLDNSGHSGRSELSGRSERSGSQGRKVRSRSKSTRTRSSNVLPEDDVKSAVAPSRTQSMASTESERGRSKDVQKSPARSKSKSRRSKSGGKRERRSIADKSPSKERRSITDKSPSREEELSLLKKRYEMSSSVTSKGKKMDPTKEQHRSSRSKTPLKAKSSSKSKRSSADGCSSSEEEDCVHEMQGGARRPGLLDSRLQTDTKRKALSLLFKVASSRSLMSNTSRSSIED